QDKRLAYYHRLEDSLESEDVTWLPFGAESETELDSVFRAIIRLGDTAEFYDPTRVLRQFGYVKDKPDEIPWLTKCICGFQIPYVVT
ncbi:hypothetical protein LINGRAHAP2_LOCUS15242, partial [Linum grandiflorum]